MTTKLNVQWSTYVKCITFLVAIIIVAVEIGIILKLLHSFDWLLLMVGIAFLFIFIYNLFEAPVSLEVNDSQIVLNKITSQVKINFNEIETIRIYKRGTFDIRLFGSGGFCGYIGHFSSKEIGKYRAYVGNYNQAFLIKTRNKKNYVLSCEDRDLIISRVKAKIG
ncbi:PH (Pleckstrin Homology) domain-containing protein [Dysgonomonas alginatilytica]|uniref:PH (Pleckstrin Homology) domain-containing protein n=1 Tax=Dysgonomonas alginatilytica TaxID=1605892 RepID=A0A2V3PJY7_9BACT|nr:PH domain-containing protein [Dysgonomonas alginatilytica]PXV58899.1 PH (Pleckstrin Homology) domain-containing protein [Dysgonomonas alginatilytica]